jgi:hypothetical protein
LGGFLRHERTPSPADRAPTRNSSTDSTSNIVYFIEELGPSTSSSRQDECLDNGSHSSRSGTVDLVADSCYDTPESSPLHVTRNFFDNSFQHPILDFRDDEQDANESYFDTVNCADPLQEASCELLFVRGPKMEATEKTCPICKIESASISTDNYTSQLQVLEKEDLISFVEAYCDGIIESASQAESNEIEWPDILQEDVCKEAIQPGSARMSVDLSLNNEPEPQIEATIANLLHQRCEITFEANQAAHIELLEEDNLSPDKPRALSPASSYSSDDDSDSSSSSSCSTNVSSVEEPQ